MRTGDSFSFIYLWYSIAWCSFIFAFFLSLVCDFSSFNSFLFLCVVKICTVVFPSLPSSSIPFLPTLLTQPLPIYPSFLFCLPPPLSIFPFVFYLQISIHAPYLPPPLTSFSTPFHLSLIIFPSHTHLHTFLHPSLFLFPSYLSHSTFSSSQ